MAIIQVSKTRNGNQAIAYLQGKGHNGNARRNELISGINCSSDINEAKESYHSVWKAYHTRQRNSVEMYRYTQAFSTEELDPDNPDDIQQAHEMGLRLANKIMNNTNHVCLVATQKDGVGGNLHNHIFMCNQAFDTGRCIRDNQKNVKDLQNWNDEVVHEFGMQQPDSIEKPLNSIKAGVRVTMTEHKLREQGQYVWKDDLRSRIDNVQQTACDWNEYINQLDNQGVKVRAFKRSAYNDDGTIDISKHLKHVSYSFTDADGKERKARERVLGTDYGFDNVNMWLENNKQERMTNNETTKEQWNDFVNRYDGESDEQQGFERNQERYNDDGRTDRENERQRQQLEQQHQRQTIKRARRKKRHKSNDGPEL